MHFVVVGTGSIGAYVGGRLACGGADVIFVGRSAVLEAIARAGLTVTDLDGFRGVVSSKAFAGVTTCAEARARLDGKDVVVLLAVKGPATSAAAAEIAAAFGAGTPVVSLQNGVDNVDRIRAAGPELDAIAAIVPYNVVWPSDTQVHRATGGELSIGAAEKTFAIVAEFEKAGVGLHVVDDMRSVQWGKLLINLNNAVNALSGVPLRDELADRDYRRAWALMIAEGLAALRAAGIKPAKVLSVGPELLVRALGLPNPLFRILARRMAKVDPSARSSMYDDLNKGRPTEIDDLCGALVRLGQRAGVPTPGNATMVRLIHNFDGRHFTGHELLKALRS